MDKIEKERLRKKEYYHKNKEKVLAQQKSYREDNKDKVLAGRLKYRVNNKQQLKEYSKKYRETNRIKEVERHKKYHREHREKRSQYAIDRYRNNIQVRLAFNIRRRLRHALKGHIKSGSTIELLGCSWSYLQGYLERKFQVGMSRENYGDWHIDHITPLSAVDLTDHEQLKKVCHYTNLQPLWATDNFRKGNKCPE